LTDYPRITLSSRFVFSYTQLLRFLEGREGEVARLVASRHSNKAIEKELGILPRTVTTHLTSIYGKMDVGSRGELVDLVRERGWWSGS
jgi:DNA-binding CsgD family transcriptional regulator